MLKFYFISGRDDNTGEVLITEVEVADVKELRAEVADLGDSTKLYDDRSINDIRTISNNIMQDVMNWDKHRADLDRRLAEESKVPTTQSPISEPAPNPSNLSLIDRIKQTAQEVTTQNV